MDLSLKKVILAVVLVFALANLVILDVLIITPRNETKQTTKELESTEEEVEKLSQPENSCQDSCKEYIDEQIANLEENVVNPEIQSNAIEEIYIPLGSATTQANNWQSVPGLEAQVDSTKYPNITTATFEATVNIPNATQQVWLQLYDETNNHPVWFSQVNYQGGSSATLISNPINLSQGNVTYQVQAQTQLGAPLEIINARIHLIVQ